MRTTPRPDASVYGHGDDATATRLAQEHLYRGFARATLAEVRARCGGGALRLLDIGCNVGTLVEEASMDGFDAWGVDLDPGAIEAGRLRGRNVWLGEATLDELPSGFDVIVLNHVLEHVIDLPTFVPPVAARLVSGGLLFVNVPNFAGLVPRLMGANWGALWPDQHAWQFEPDTLVRTVESLAPLACVARETSTNLEPPSRGLKGSVKRAVLALSCRLRVGDELRVVFRRH